MKKLSIAVLGAMLLPMSSVCAETQPTVEGAHAFIKELIDRGAVKVEPTPVIQYGVNATAGYIHGLNLTYLSNRGCNTSIRLMQEEIYDGEFFKKLGADIEVNIDWGKVSVISFRTEFPADNVALVGGISIKVRQSAERSKNIKQLDTFSFVAESTALRDRVFNAMNFLRKECDSGKKYGF